MTHWNSIPDAPVPDADAWDGDDYQAMSSLSAADLLRVAWNLRCSHSDLEWQALDLAQDLSCEFQMMDYATIKEEFRHEESLRRQEAGIRYMKHAYAIAGFTDDVRERIADAAAELTATGRTVLNPLRGNVRPDA